MPQFGTKIGLWTLQTTRQDAPGWQKMRHNPSQNVSKTALKPLQDAPKTPQGAPKMSQGAPVPPHEASKGRPAPSRLRFWRSLATILDDFQIDFKTILEACEDHVPARLGKFLAKFGFVVDLLYIWLSSDLLFGFERSPPDRPKIDWNLPTTNLDPRRSFTATI